jgi:AraC family transcriptional regulator, regulatory protein of adaptative response / methylated-DNA-[protein]-cysteine methyltransferase
MLNFEQCWNAVQKRDREQDDRFFFGVVTTGVYCRPSCPSRRALRRNVRFYETPEEAERDGLRPCLRCHPLEIAGGAEARQMREICRYIEEHAAGRLDGIGTAVTEPGPARTTSGSGQVAASGGRPDNASGRLGRAGSAYPKWGFRSFGDLLAGESDCPTMQEQHLADTVGQALPPANAGGQLDGIDMAATEAGPTVAAGRLDLAALAARAGLSRFHLQRRFKAVIGVTPREYGEACRMRRLKSELRQSQDVTEAVYAAGFGSSSRVYERADTRLGMTPNQYRRGGEGMAISYASAPTPVGLMMLAATDRGLCFLQFGESEQALAAALHGEYPAAQIAPMSAARGAEFREWMEALRQHLDGQRPQMDLPLDIRATAFQMRVWNYLQGIPYGQVRSYAQVAAGIGSPTAARAVARACASNTVALAIPCHRVIRGSGELGGYRWGLERKQALLSRERGIAARRA